MAQPMNSHCYHHNPSLLKHPEKRQSIRLIQLQFIYAGRQYIPEKPGLSSLYCKLFIQKNQLSRPTGAEWKNLLNKLSACSCYSSWQDKLNLAARTALIWST